MPKASNTPLSCIFALNKPTGQPSMTLLNKLQPLLSSSTLFKDPNAKDQGGNKKGGRRGKWKENRIKLGQGGTLDPLADGVLVLGTNSATKQLSQFLDCTKSYRAIALLGCSTDSYDSDGKIVRMTGWEGVSKELVEEKLGGFRGEIEQTPPVYSALKMDGKPLYEYARSNTPLPRPIPSRKVTISEIKLLSFTNGEDRTDSYEFPKEKLGDEERKEMERLEKMVKEGGTVVPSTEEIVKDETTESKAKEAETVAQGVGSEGKPPIFEISLTVSSGTYIRSVIHDLGIALGSSAHVVKLTRTRQGQFALDPSSASSSTSTAALASTETESTTTEEKREEKKEVEKELKGCIEWTLLEKAIKRQELIKKGSEEAKQEADKEREQDGADGYLEWEREILRLCETV
ncbi:pseudouridine synthase PUS4 [Sporobolomyces salmoneus]|uniref:pseudouridine synthase PUS4 n=1 Tax=Sporobolomyces salmoneus TaxID=183962 RepID=UPI00317F51E5